jgi:DNA-binding NtrC family response regulator
MDEPTQRSARLVLLIDSDPAIREVVQPLLGPHALELIHARTSVSALELLQRIPDRFRLAIVSMEMAGLSGTVLLETLRLFRPELPVVCLTAAEPATVTAGNGNCLPKPVNVADLRGQLEDAFAGNGNSVAGAGAVVAPEAIARAKASFAVWGNLLEAARELARGMPGEPASGW